MLLGGFAITARLDVSIIVVSHNTRDALRECLDSLKASSGGASFEVIVIDNGSCDGSAEMVSSEYPAARLIRNEFNLGYAKAANQGLRAMDGRYALMVNSDVALSEGCLDMLVRFVDANADVGAVSPLLSRNDGSPRNTAAAYPSIITEVFNKGLLKLLAPRRYPGKNLKGRVAIEVDSLVGACMALRSEAVYEAGLFDESFFLYLEDTDLCLRLKALGWKVCVLPSVKVYHRGGASASAMGAKARIEYYLSLGRFFAKHRSKLSGTMLWPALGLKFLVNLLCSFVAVSVSLYLLPTLRTKLRTNAELFWWYLKRGPENCGLGFESQDERARLPLTLKSDEKILIIKQSSMGDIIHTLPALAALRRTYPRAGLFWSAERAFVEILDGNPCLDGVFTLNTRMQKGILKPAKALAEICNNALRLRGEKFDIVIDFQGLAKTSILSYLCGAKVRIGFERSREPCSWLYTHRVKIDGDELHAVDRYIALLRALGVKDAPLRFFIPRTSFNLEAIDKFLASIPQDGREIVVIHPSAGKAANIWLEERYCELGDRIIEDFGALLILTGSRADAGLVRRIASKMSGSPIDAAGKLTLGQMGELLRKAKLFIGGDTGPLHLAAAVSCEVVAIFGAANPKRTGPYMALDNVVVPEAACSPCYKWRCKSLECMESITVEKVYGLVKKAMG